MAKSKGTIFMIDGGGQRVRQCAELGMPIVIEKVENSDLPEKSGTVGQDFFTGHIWHCELSRVKEWAAEWAEGYGELDFA